MISCWSRVASAAFERSTSTSVLGHFGPSLITSVLCSVTSIPRCYSVVAAIQRRLVDRQLLSIECSHSAAIYAIYVLTTFINSNKCKQESRAAARKPRDAASVLFG